MKDEGLTIDAVIPFGPCMRYTYLRQIILNGIKTAFSNLTEFSLTTNMDEDISIGACRMSHLLVENRLRIDDRLIGNGVFGVEKGMGKEEIKENAFFITFSDGYENHNRSKVFMNVENSSWERMKESMCFGSNG